jgi:hypothetical protein
MINSKDGIAATQDRSCYPLVKRTGLGLPSSTGHQSNGKPVRVRWPQDIDSKLLAMTLSINEASMNLDGWMKIPPEQGDSQDDNCQHGSEEQRQIP